MLILRSDLNLVGRNALSGGGHGRFLYRNLLTKTFNFSFNAFSTLEKNRNGISGGYFVSFTGKNEKIEKYFARAGARTLDVQVKSLTLYQLSYPG